jgi:DNA-binding GntR family transcriptional regulator
MSSAVDRVTYKPFEVDRTTPRPIHQQIQDWIRYQITSLAWPEHYQLRAENDLAAELGVSRGTVREAVTKLIEEGLLIRIHGKGTFVSTRHLEQPLAERMVSFSEDLIDKGIPFQTQVLDQSIVHAPQPVASLLSVTPDTEVLHLKRRRFVRQMPVIVIENYILLGKCPGVERVDFTHHRLLATLEVDFGLQLDWARRTFEAQRAGEEIARLLGIAVGDPVMRMNQILYLKDASPIETSNVWLRGEGFRLSAIVNRHAKGRGSTSLLTF